MPTPHIAARPGRIAPAVLMPGDPRRAERMARALMPDAELVSDVRGIGCYTGEVDGTPLSVMASGMGIPSLSIYATELFREYDVQRIIRVGTAGGMSSTVAVGDVVIATGAHSDSSVVSSRIPGITFAAVASFDLVAAAVAAARDEDEGQAGTVHTGPVVSRDRFYGNPPEQVRALADYGTLGVEMEAAGLYACAAEFGRQALAVVTISDHLFDGSKDMSAEERETSFGRALRLATAAALS